MLNDDGDIIKACGFLAIYSGNLEDELDELYGLAKSFCPEQFAVMRLKLAIKEWASKEARTDHQRPAPDRLSWRKSATGREM